MTKWIDNDFACVETIGYLVETLNTTTGKISFSLRERPLRTNGSNEPRLTGWCGETDNKSRYARGVWKVVKVNQCGDRAQIVEMTGEALASWLEHDGYPELAPSHA